ncbi:ribonuclease T2-like protein [Mariannaea sp. PMI_226]|nr:ribonuclease T2-like protein [Mariannaea sp. PMI_226]
MSPSSRVLIPVALLLGEALAFSAASCPNNLPLSCHNNTVVENTCCFIPSGQILQTQFWDTKPAAGPSSSWTIHGLWPDNCDGTYPQNCDSSRAYTNIGDIVSEFLDDSTLDYMNTYWVSNDGDDESFWEHEWGKHGTCISTLNPDCYDEYQTGEEAADYINRVVSLFKTLPTYQWLSDAGIKPSTSKTYTSNQIQSALEEQHGAPVTIGCNGKYLDEVWYHFNVRGSLQEGTFVAADPDGTKSSCPSTGIKYVPKN